VKMIGVSVSKSRRLASEVSIDDEWETRHPNAFRYLYMFIFYIYLSIYLSSKL
jgi:hypothetical protein